MGFELEDFLQLSHESSLPVSSTIVAFCGGEPTEMVIVRVTLCWKESLLGAEEGRWKCPYAFFKGKMSDCFEGKHGN